MKKKNNMRKIITILALLALVVGAGAALNLMTWDGSKDGNFLDTANWTGTVSSGNALSSSDSCLMNTGAVTATASGTTSIGFLYTTSGYSGSLSFSGQNVTIAKGFVDSGTGAKNYGAVQNWTDDGFIYKNSAGSGAITANACSLVVSGTADIYQVKNVGWKTIRWAYPSKTITMHGNFNNVSKAGDTAIYLMGGTWNLGGGNAYCQLSASGTFYSLNGSTVSGSGAFYTQNTANGITTAIPATSSAAVAMFLGANSTNQTSTININGILNLTGSSSLYTAGSGSSQKITINTNNYSITVPSFNLNSSAGVTFIYNSGSSAHTFSGASAMGSAAGIDTIHGGTSTWSFGGNLNNGAGLVIDQTPAFTFTPIANATFTTASRLYYDISKTGTKKITQSGNLYCNDFSVSAGQWIMPSSGVDSCRDYSRTTTDTVWRAGNLLKIGRNLTSTGSGIIIPDATTWIEFCGVGSTHSLTVGTNRLEKVRLVDNGILNLASRARILSLYDSLGTLNLATNTLVIDSILTIVDSIYTSATDSILDSGSVVMRTTGKPNLKGLLEFMGNKLNTIVGGGLNRSFGRANINRGGSGGIMLSGSSFWDTIKTTNGILIDTIAGDTLKSNALLLNNVSDSSVFNGVVTGKYISIAEAASINWRINSKIVALSGDSLAIVSNNNILPAIHNRGKMRIQ
jgi:hypothetical protein